MSTFSGAAINVEDDDDNDNDDDDDDDDDNNDVAGSGGDVCGGVGGGGGKNGDCDAIADMSIGIVGASLSLFTFFRCHFWHFRYFFVPDAS